MGNTGRGNTSNGGVPVGDIQFYEAIIPPLEDGDYTLVATQTLESLPGKSPAIEPVALKFSVRGPRFKLNPADVYSAFPPPSPPTPYEGQIPHLVVSRKTLPWERLLAPGQPRSTPWLALLTVYEDDAGGIPKVGSGVVGDLIAAADGGKRPPAIGGPAITASDLDAGESLGDPCSYIDLPAELFAAIAPRLDEIPFLSHARAVNTGNKPIEGILGDGVYSIIVGNRVSHGSALNGAFLVSLEGFQELLTGQAPIGVTAVRLVVLYSWLFRMGGQDPFDTLMSAGHSGLLAVSSPDVTQDKAGTHCTRKAMTISPPQNSGSQTFPDDTVSYALQSGYAALSHNLREGSRTFSWYRGPLIPYPLGLVLNSDNSIPVFRSADELLRYNPESGLFDTTYAAAFQLGRLLALQNETFLATLRTYFHEIRGQALRLANRKALLAAEKSPLELPGARSDLLRRTVVLDATVRWLAANATATLSVVAGGGTSGDRRRRAVNGKNDSVTGTRLSRLHGFLSDETNRTDVITAAPPPPDTVVRWLANLVLLTGVPFEYLAPDERMLPQESVRFFFVDENWIARLIDGALSVVGRTTLDQLITDVLRAIVRQPVSDSVAGVRPRLLGTPAAPIEAETLKWPLTGFLVRSAVVDHWKGIVIENTSKDSPHASLTTLRLDRPAQGVLLGLYNGTLGSVTFKHPPESLHFGIDGQQGSPQTWQQKLRRLDNGLYEDKQVEIKFHNQERRVIDVCASQSAMKGALSEKPARFTSAELAIEMVESPKSVTFEMLYP